MNYLRKPLKSADFLNQLLFDTSATRMKLSTSLMLASILCSPLSAMALSFPLPAPNNDIVGANQTTTIKPGQDLHDVGRSFDIGYDAMVAANPSVNFAKIKKNTQITVPSQFILPPGQRVGIIINVAAKRLYYFPQGQNVVYTFPIGVGLLGWSTPTGQTQVIEKIKNPVWTVPDSIFQKLAAQGIYLPKQILPGPDDPLGDFALRLAIPGYLIHGTNEPDSIGTRASSGCIRMFPEDIQQLFSVVPTKTPVRLINMPYMAGWNNNQLYLQVYQPPVDAVSSDQASTYSALMQTVTSSGKPAPIMPNDTNSIIQQVDSQTANGSAPASAAGNSAAAPTPVNSYLSVKDALTQVTTGQPANVNWQQIKVVTAAQSGMPIAVGTAVNPVTPAANPTSESASSSSASTPATNPASAPVTNASSASSPATNPASASSNANSSTASMAAQTSSGSSALPPVYDANQPVSGNQ